MNPYGYLKGDEYGNLIGGTVATVLTVIVAAIFTHVVPFIIGIAAGMFWLIVYCF